MRRCPYRRNSSTSMIGSPAPIVFATLPPSIVGRDRKILRLPRDAGFSARYTRENNRPGQNKLGGDMQNDLRSTELYKRMQQADGHWLQLGSGRTPDLY